MSGNELIDKIETAIAFAYDEMGGVDGMVAPRQELMLTVQHSAALRKQIAEARDNIENLTAGKADEIDRLKWVIRQMLDCLPVKRDWLDPAVEREARDLTDARKGGGR